MVIFISLSVNEFLISIWLIIIIRGATETIHTVQISNSVRNMKFKTLHGDIWLVKFISIRIIHFTIIMSIPMKGT